MNGEERGHAIGEARDEYRGLTRRDELAAWAADHAGRYLNCGECHVPIPADDLEFHLTHVHRIAPEAAVRRVRYARRRADNVRVR